MATFGFIGTGNMGGILARAACKRIPSDQIFLANRTMEKAKALAEELDCRVADNDAVAANADFIFLGVKPQMMAGMLADIAPILEGYLANYDHADEQSQWFDKIRTMAESLGYAAKPKDYKKNPDLYKGHVGDVSTVIRIALMGRASSPDLWNIQQIMGEDMVRERIGSALK
jgi:hypothetical protein